MPEQSGFEQFMRWLGGLFAQFLDWWKSLTPQQKDLAVKAVFVVLGEKASRYFQLVTTVSEL